MIFNSYPYLDFHELNLDTILRLIHEMHKEITDFEAVNKITNAGAWDITKQYQAWTIVSNNNKGYISLKPVPTGVAIVNTEYWGLIADYDILITDLSNRISDLENDMAIVKPATFKLTPLNEIDGKKILVIGDSIGDEDIARFQPNYITYLRRKIKTMGGTLDNNSKGGRCISSNSTPEGGIVEALAEITTYDYDIIIIELGINDYNMQADIDDVKSGLVAFETWRTTNCPGAVVYMITPLSTNHDSTKVPLAYYRDIILYFASARSYKIIDSYAMSDCYNGTVGGLRTLYTDSGDGVHPNTTYAPIYANFIYRALMAGGTAINYNGVATCTNSGLTIDTTPVNIYYRPGGRIQLACNTLATFTPGNTILRIGTIPAWAAPYFDTNMSSYVGYDVVVRKDRAVYIVFNNGLTTYNSVGINLSYDCINNQMISLS